MEYRDIVKFHGHECPGLGIGYRMATAAMKRLEMMRAEDEEIDAIIENNACGADALQCVTGCSFGKGNLVYNDYGKHVYTLYSRKTGKGVRVSYTNRQIPAGLSREQMINFLMKAQDAEILIVSEVTVKEPEPARIFKPFPCDICGENVMETRLREMDSKKVCIPCSLSGAPREQAL